MIRMNGKQRAEFIDWRNPQYDGPFSCLGDHGRRLTWVPSMGIFEACDVPQHIIKSWMVPSWDRSAVL